MKRILYIIVCLVMASCASHKQIPVATVYDADWEKMEQAFQRSRDAFFASDSADIIVNDLGWARRLVTDAKIQEGTIPSIYKNKGTTFTIELPCWEGDTNDYMSANVIAEHKRLDSALVKAKIQGVDEIFRRSQTYIAGYVDLFLNSLNVDSLSLTKVYSNYIRTADFYCLCIMKDKNKYIINATIRVPAQKDKNIKLKALEKAILENKMTEQEILKYLEPDTHKTDNVGSPSE